jgi:PAS domain S-box-containing protein
MKLSTKFLVPTVLLISIGMGILTVISFVYSRNAIEESVVAQLEQLLSSTIDNYANWVESRSSDLDTWSNREVCITALDHSFIGLSARKSFTQDLIKLKAQYEYYHHVFLVDRDGTVISASTPEMLGKHNVAGTEFFAQVLQGSKSISPVYRDTVTENPVFVMAMPVLENGVIKGVLCTEFDLIALNNKFIDKIRIGQSGNAFIIDNRDGRILAHPDSSAILQENMNNGVQGGEMLNSEKGHLHIVSAMDTGQRERLVVYDILRELNWKIAIGADTDEMNAPIIKIRNINFIITVTIICAACLIIFLVIQKNIIRPMQRLQTSAEHLSHGSLDYPIDIGRKDELGSLAQSFAVMRDAIKIQMRELKATEKKYRDIFENAVEGIFQLTIDGRFISANQAMATIFGYDTAEELIASVHNITDRFHHPPAQQKAPFAGLAERGLISGLERSYKRKDGSVFWGAESMRAVRDDNGGLLHFEGSLIDITERKKAEEALRESEERFRQFVEGTDNLITRVNGQGKFTYVNHIGEKIFGISAEEYDGMSAFRFVHPDDRQKTRQWFRGCVENRFQQASIENRQVNRETGEIFHLLWNCTFHFDDDGTVNRVDSIAHDITARKQIEEALQKAHGELEQRVEQRTRELQKTHTQLLHAEKLSAVGRLSASIAHEFNNPLQGVMSVINGIKRRTPLDDADGKLVDMAIRECNRMKDFIKDLQDFNRPTSGRMAPIDIHETIDSTLRLTNKDLKTRKIVVEKDYAFNLPLMQVVGDQLIQVLLNLLNNGADACEGGGTIVISTRVQGNKLILSVRDNGKGIAPEHLDHVFEPFFTTKPEVKGIGLGLSVSYGIIKRHGGTIDVESELGKGTMFTITMPIAGGAHVEQVDTAG